MYTLFTKYINVISDKKSKLLIQGVDYAEIKHIIWMCNRGIEMEDVGKANRWLGFVQGVLFSWRVYTIDELRNDTRKALEMEAA